MPTINATTVPIARPSSTARRESILTLLSTITTAKVNSAREMLGSDAKSGLGTVSPATTMVALPVIQRAATGMRDSPMMVMMEPVTTEGKNRTTFAKKGVITKPKMAATITAPNTCRRPSSPLSPMMASIVETAAKEVPCTSGSWAPK